MKGLETLIIVFDHGRYIKFDDGEYAFYIRVIYKKGDLYKGVCGIIDVVGDNVLIILSIKGCSQTMRT